MGFFAGNTERLLRRLKFRVSFSQFSGVTPAYDALTGAILPAGAVPEGWSMEVLTPFAGGSITSCLLQLGTAASAVAYSESTGREIVSVPAGFRSTDGRRVDPAWKDASESNTEVQARLNNMTGGTADDLTQGEVEVSFYYFLP